MRCIDPQIKQRISTLRFRHNAQTTQEGTTRRIGDSYEVTVNFCLKNYRSRILNVKNKKYLNEKKRFGGSIDLENREVRWSPSNAKRYATFLLLHEIGHVAYYEKYLDLRTDNGSTKKEEDWCDTFSVRTMKKLGENTGGEQGQPPM